jgi:hypothetical protein
MPVKFGDCAAALGYTDMAYTDAIPSRAQLPVITAAQGAMLASWAATANATGPGQTRSLISFWAYSLGVTMPQIGVFCIDNS